MPRVTGSWDGPSVRATRRAFLKAAAAGIAFLRAVKAAGTSCIRAPYVQVINAGEAVVMWTLDANIDAVLRMTDSSGATQTIVPEIAEFKPQQTGLPASYFQYSARVTGLNPDAAYSYAVERGRSVSLETLARSAQFRTAPSGPSFTFLHFADSGTGRNAQLGLAAQMARENAQLVLANGDLAYEDATHASVETNYFDVYRDLMARIPFFASLGNHEYYTDDARPSLAARVTPTSGVPEADWGRYYSFDWGNAHFVALDSNTPLLRVAAGDSSMLDWLDADLSATRKFWRIVYFHHPPYATGIHENEPEAILARERIVPILERYGVQIVFNGHEHTYQRSVPLLGGTPAADGSNGIVYITSGGGGHSVYDGPAADFLAERRGVNHYVRTEVAGSGLNLSAITADGTVVDTTRIRPRPNITGPVVEGASFSANVASGGLVTLFGFHLSSSVFVQDAAGAAQGEVALSLGGNRVPVLYADARQINAQLPFGFSGDGELTVQTPNGTARVPLRVAPVAPTLFLDASGFAVAQHDDGQLISAERPARSGEVVTLMLTGLGDVRGDAKAGVRSKAPLPVLANVQVTLSGVALEVVEAVLSTRIPGVYELRVRIPEGVTGAVTVQVTGGGIASAPALLQIA